MARPSQPHLLDSGDARHRAHHFLGLRDQAGVDTIQQAAPNVAGGAPQQNADGDSDDQPDDRVGQQEAEPDTDYAQYDRQ